MSFAGDYQYQDLPCSLINGSLKQPVRIRLLQIIPFFVAIISVVRRSTHLKLRIPQNMLNSNCTCGASCGSSFNFLCCRIGKKNWPWFDFLVQIFFSFFVECGSKLGVLLSNLGKKKLAA